MNIESKEFEEISDSTIPSKCSDSVSNQTFWGLYGFNLNVASIIWKEIYKALPAEQYRATCRGQFYFEKDTKLK